jgi:hypothetical protein
LLGWRAYALPIAFDRRLKPLFPALESLYPFRKYFLSGMRAEVVAPDERARRRWELLAREAGATVTRGRLSSVALDVVIVASGSRPPDGLTSIAVTTDWLVQSIYKLEAAKFNLFRFK